MRHLALFFLGILWGCGTKLPPNEKPEAPSFEGFIQGTYEALPNTHFAKCLGPFFDAEIEILFLHGNPVEFLVHEGTAYPVVTLNDEMLTAQKENEIVRDYDPIHPEIIKDIITFNFFSFSMTGTAIFRQFINGEEKECQAYSEFSFRFTNRNVEGCSTCDF